MTALGWELAWKQMNAGGVPEPGRCAGFSLLVAIEMRDSSPRGFVRCPAGVSWSCALKWLLLQKSGPQAWPFMCCTWLVEGCPAAYCTCSRMYLVSLKGGVASLTAFLHQPRSISFLWMLCNDVNVWRLLLGAFKGLVWVLTRWIGCPLLQSTLLAAWS